MKKIILVLIMASTMIGIIACGKEAEFVLGENLAGAITELALKYDAFDSAVTKEESYPNNFISSFCQNSRFTFDYLEEVIKENDGMLSRDQIEYIQYGLTGENVDFTEYVDEEGVDAYQSTSGLGFGEIVSYEAEVSGSKVNLVAEYWFRSNHDIEAEHPTKVYELTVVLEKNKESCFDGYSIKSINKKDVTPVVYGDGKQHAFYGMDMGIEEDSVFILECFGGADNIAYGTHVEVDLSENPDLAEVVRANPGEELEVIYIWDSTVEEPITRVIPIDIKIENKVESIQDEETDFSGMYTDMMGTEDIYSELILVKREDGDYNFAISLHRLTTIGGKATQDGDKIHFVGIDASGEPIEGDVVISGESATATFTDSTWAYIENGDTYTFPSGKLEIDELPEDYLDFYYKYEWKE